MNCRVCGRQFDPEGFQVMVPGLRARLRPGRLCARGEPPRPAAVSERRGRAGRRPRAADGRRGRAGSGRSLPGESAGRERSPAVPRRRQPGPPRRRDRADHLPLAPCVRRRRRPVLVPGRERLGGLRPDDGLGNDRPLASPRSGRSPRTPFAPTLTPHLVARRPQARPATDGGGALVSNPSATRSHRAARGVLPPARLRPLRHRLPRRRLPSPTRRGRPPVPTYPVPSSPPDDRVPGPGAPRRLESRAARAARQRPAVELLGPAHSSPVV